MIPPLLPRFLILFSALFFSSIIMAIPPLVDGDRGTKARFIDQGRTGIMVPPMTSDTIICEPSLLGVIAKAGLGSGRNCLRFTNNDANGVNYLPFKANSIVSFARFYLSDGERDMCVVVSNPWTGWAGKPETACGEQTFKQTNQCVIPPFGCSDTCPWAPDGTFEISREISIEDGTCCDDELYFSDTGLTKAQTASTCFSPGTVGFLEFNQCGDVRNTTLDCGNCNAEDWTSESGLTPSESADRCISGDVFNFVWANDCGGRQEQLIDCTACNSAIWLSESGKSIGEAAQECSIGEIFVVVNGCGLIQTAPCIGS